MSVETWTRSFGCATCASELRQRMLLPVLLLLLLLSHHHQHQMREATNKTSPTRA
jgi:hypothetical protein